MSEPDRDQLVEDLTALLEAERAGARVGASLVAEAPDPALRRLAEIIHADEVKWARALFEALIGLGVEPSQKVGDFYQKAMAIPDFRDRLAFTNRGQGWVVRKVQALLPRVTDASLHQVLTAIFLRVEPSLRP